MVLSRARIQRSRSSCVCAWKWNILWSTVIVNVLSSSLSIPTTAPRSRTQPRRTPRIIFSFDCKQSTLTFHIPTLPVPRRSIGRRGDRSRLYRVVAEDPSRLVHDEVAILPALHHVRPLAQCALHLPCCKSTLIKQGRISPECLSFQDTGRVKSHLPFCEGMNA